MYVQQITKLKIKLIIQIESNGQWPVRPRINDSVIPMQLCQFVCHVSFKLHCALKCFLDVFHRYARTLSISLQKKVITSQVCAVINTAYDYDDTHRDRFHGNGSAPLVLVLNESFRVTQLFLRFLAHVLRHLRVVASVLIEYL